MDFIQQLAGYVLGLVMVGGLLGFIYYRDAVDWRNLQTAYGRAWAPPVEKKSLQTMILYSEGRPAKSYKGLLTIGLYPDGIGIRPFIFLVPFQSPIFVPYSEIKGWKQKWFLDAASTELAFAKTPAMRVIMPTKQVEWILSLAQGAVPISPDRPPTENWPWLTFSWAIISAIMAMIVIAIVIAKV